jgi:dienelactone hydrolase
MFAYRSPPIRIEEQPLNPSLTIRLKNSLADSFARAGYLTIIPDVFSGDPAPIDMMNSVNKFDFATWLRNHPTEKVDGIIEATMKGLREEYGIKRIGAVGYCFGGRFVARFLTEGKSLDAGYVAHPSLTTDAEWEAVRGPLSVAGAGTCALTESLFVDLTRSVVNFEVK